jgi:tetratricopeptide (TPR) repeat protein/predicted Ser/Thr protein kinase
MTPERWQAVKRLFEDALQREPAQRAGYLADVAKTDPTLADEVRALLSAQGRAEEVFGGVTRTAGLKTLGPGTRLGPYEIVSLLGAGGMGEVYRARDTRLDRTVAIKVLPTDVAADAEARRRFEREARTISKLNHPHICSLHDVGEQDGLSFLVMEYLEGESLADRLSRGPLPLDEALRYARQIAEALEEAHEHGIVHRDLKPGNVMLTKKGAKLLDFGIAKLRAAVVSEEVPTATASVLTGEGLIVGTPQYMAPEQLEGRPVDARTDIFAFGVVVYEMVTGRKAFEGSSRASLIAAILERDPPPLGKFQPAAPRPLEALVKRCLEKDPARRWQSAGEIQTAMVTAGGEVMRQPRATGRRVAVGLAAGAVVVGVAAALVMGRGPILTERDTILLADFVNTTGDPVFDGTLKQALASQVEQTPFLSVFGDERIRETLRLMGRSPEERVTGPLARELCEREEIKAMLTGSIAALGSHYVISLDAVNCRTGDALARQQVEAARKEDVLKALDEPVQVLRRRLGESLASIQRFHVPIERATTSSLEALKAASTGAELAKGGVASELKAVPFLKRALELDSNFAWAYSRLASIYNNALESELGREYATKAYELRDRVSQAERLAITSQFHTIVTGDVPKAIEAMELWKEIYPHEWKAPNNLGYRYLLTGQCEKAVAEFQESIRRNPNFAYPIYSLSNAFICLNRFDEAKAVIEGAVREGKLSPGNDTRYRIAFVQGDAAAMNRELEAVRGKPVMERVMRDSHAAAAAFSGRLAKSRELAREAAQVAQRTGLRQSAAVPLSGQAQREALVGNDEEARRLGGEALALDHAPDTRLNVAVSLALAGDVTRAQKLIDAVAPQFPSATLVNGVLIPNARAAMELRRGTAARAVEHLRVAAPYDRVNPLGIYLRGQACLKAGSAAAATVEFQKIVANRGASAVNVVYPLAHLGLGRAAALAGDAPRSRKAYQDFFAFWKDADPDIPVLLEAMREYEALKRSSVPSSRP